MHRFLMLFAMVACALTGFACQPESGARNIEYAAVESQPVDTLLLGHKHVEKPVEKQEKPPSKDLPKILIEARFITVPLADLRQQELISGDDVQVVTPEHAQKLLEWTQLMPTSSNINAPRLVAYSGQSASVCVYTNEPYVQDFEFKANQQGLLVPASILGQYSKGTQLEVQATLEGDEIVFDRISPTVTHALGIRKCQASVVTQAGTSIINWQEPYLLVADAPSIEKTPIRVRSGHTLLLPLRYHVVQGAAANARAMASGGKVAEVYRSKTSDHTCEAGRAYSPRFPQPSPLNRQCVLMIRASVLEV